MEARDVDELAAAPAAPATLIVVAVREGEQSAVLALDRHARLCTRG